VGWRQLVSRFAAVIVAAPMATPIVHFISLEVPGRSVPSCSSIAVVRETAFVAVLAIVPVIHMAIEVIRAMKPRASSDEGASMEPFRTVVAIRGTAIRAVVIVAVRTFRSDSDADMETDLRHCLGSSRY